MELDKRNSLNLVTGFLTMAFDLASFVDLGEAFFSASVINLSLRMTASALNLLRRSIEILLTALVLPATLAT